MQDGSLDSTVQLICEGRCNGIEIDMIDALVRRAAERWQRASNAGPVLYADSDVGLIKRQRALTYTEHRVNGHAKAVCVDCGTERQWG